MRFHTDLRGVYLTVSEDNAVSRRVIERNGETVAHQIMPDHQRATPSCYWIP